MRKLTEEIKKKISLSMKGKKKSLETWNYECQICGKKGVFLHSNHIKRFVDYKNDRFNVNNGICLCSQCHITLVNQHEVEWESYFNFCWENKSL